MDLQVAAVDPVVVGDDQLRQLDVLVLDRLQGAVEGGDDQVEAAQGARLELARAPLGTACASRLGPISRTCRSRTPRCARRRGW